MQSATKKSESAALEPAARKSAPAPKRAKLSVLLVTRDDQLWPQVGGNLGQDLVLKQVDTIDELLSTTTSGQPAIVLLDARGEADGAAALSRLQLHSPRFAVVALDDVGSGHTWTGAIALRQVVAHVAVPIQADKLIQAIENAHEEVNARVALLGESGAVTPDGTGTSSTARKIPWIPIAVTLAAAAGAAAFFAMRHGNAPVPATPAAAPQAAPQAAGKAAPAADEKIDLLIEKAQQAMTERHFIDPAEGSALTLYRNALLLDPNNGEARQGLQRLAEILFARVQSALDERKFDVALQSLETARSINPGDSRLGALDEHIAAVRAEFGPAQILAAINAQNFDRAAQLIDEAARSKSLTNAKLGQLREELRRKREESDVANLVKLIDTRLQQDKLLEPRNDSAAFYLAQARAAGASAASLQTQSQEIYKRLAQMVHADIDQRHFSDADRLLTDMHGFGYSVAATSTLQHDLSAARAAAERRRARTAAISRPRAVPSRAGQTHRARQRLCALLCHPVAHGGPEEQLVAADIGSRATANPRASPHSDRHGPTGTCRSAAANGGYPRQYAGPEHTQRAVGTTEGGRPAGRAGSFLDPDPANRTRLPGTGAAQKHRGVGRTCVHGHGRRAR